MPESLPGATTALREALAQMIELTDHADSKDPHSPWCNGVHSEQGRCEGDYIAAGIIGNARAALAAPAAGRDPAIEDADAAWRDGEAHGRDK